MRGIPRVDQLKEQDLLQGVAPDLEEKALLDQELEEFQSNPEAGATWPEVQARLHGRREM